MHSCLLINGHVTGLEGSPTASQGNGDAEVDVDPVPPEPSGNLGQMGERSSHTMDGHDEPAGEAMLRLSLMSGGLSS